MPKQGEVMESEPVDPMTIATGLLAQAAEWLFDMRQTAHGYDSDECTELREWFEMRVREYKDAVQTDRQGWISDDSYHLGSNETD
jgi:hypothetical protein